MTILIGKTPATAGPEAAAGGAGAQIRLERVTKDFGLASPAVDGVSLTIEPGEFMTLLGPSGSGKTTTLNLIAGFESLTSGTIRLDAQDVSTLPAHRRNLGIVFQNYALFPHLTVAGNIAYPLRERKVPRAEIERRVAEVLELVQLKGRDQHYPAQLSGGQQQRVALARAIVFHPRALLLDEPLGALDRNLRAALQLEIRRIHREVGTTLVFVTHDQEEAMNLSDRIALFHDGRIEQVGSPETLYGAPETLFTARFLGDSTVFPLGGQPLTGPVTWEGERWAVDAATVAARAHEGGPTALVVRPEAVGVVRDRAQVPAGANAVRARVRDIEYMGAHRMLQLAVGEDVAGRAQIPAADRSYTLGDDVVAWWRPDAQRIVAA
ncbi:ABC transporter ATP-binding protein [Dactylosporangium sp. NPDC005572]|uniref:ABC transporter ATP-binding protein n=1 Tax=Dactylosporangium sp. NPDC005572 TaxID=3156889 RepID=UPI0033A0BCA2